MANTKNYNLKKPDQKDFYNVEDFNNNFDIIDEELHTKPSMISFEKTNTFNTLLEAVNSLRYGGGFIISSQSPVSQAEDYPAKGLEFSFFVTCEANDRRKTVIAFRYNGGKLNLYHRDVYMDNWQTEWRTTDQYFLSLTGGIMSGNSIGLHSGYGQVYCDDYTLNIYSKDAIDKNSGRYLGVYNSKNTLIDALKLIDLKEDGSHVAYRVYGEHNKPTAGAIGALPATGGTITGNLTVDKSWGAIYFEDNTGRKGLVEKSPETGHLSLYSIKDSNNSNCLRISPETSNIEGAVFLRQVVNGVVNTYNFYGEHNLPSPAQIQKRSYVGAGTYGSSNRNSFTFDFSPNVVMIMGSAYLAIWIRGSSKMILFNFSNNSLDSCTADVSGNTLYWYNSSNSTLQLNSGATPYQIVAWA